MFPKALKLYLGTSGAKPGDSPCSYTFLLIHLCRNVTVYFYLCFGRQLRWFCEKKLTKKIIFYCADEALKVFRIYRCHPVFFGDFILFLKKSCSLTKQELFYLSIQNISSLATCPTRRSSATCATDSAARGMRSESISECTTRISRETKGILWVSILSVFCVVL